MTNRNFVRALVLERRRSRSRSSSAACQRQNAAGSTGTRAGISRHRAYRRILPVTAAALAARQTAVRRQLRAVPRRERRGRGLRRAVPRAAAARFRRGQFKFRTTASGQLPTDDDLFRTISRGANGTGMPPWQYLLDDDERWALVDYVKTLRRRASRQPRAASRCRCPTRPANRATPSTAARSTRRCSARSATATTAAASGPSSTALVDAKGRHVNTRDFTQPASYRTGWTEREIIRTLETGMNGVPMPSYTGVDVDAGRVRPGRLPDDAWRATARAIRSGRSRESMEGLGAPDRVITLREHAWKYEPSEIRVKRGEVVRIEFSATDNGLGAGHGFALDGLDQERVHQRRDGRRAALGHVQGRRTRAATTSIARRSAARPSCIRRCTAYWSSSDRLAERRS